MKQVVKLLLTAAAVTAFAVPAMAADKLIVKNAAGTGTAFKVDDAGTVTVRNAGDTADMFTVNNAGTVLGSKLGMGTSNPRVPLHLHLLTSTGTATDAGTTAIYSPSAGQVLSADRNSASAAFVVADNTATAGYRGSVAGVRAGGTLASPTVPAENDLVFSVIGGIWTGSSIYNTADINFTVDGTVTATNAPQRISFRTRTAGTGGYVERLTIKNDGKIIFGLGNGTTNGIPIYADNTAAASLAAGSIYRTASGVLMIKY